MSGDAARENRLAREKSPYLLQHAGNPVDWYPWGEEAFAKARREDKPVFLSIGYSTCHWCHVMERESFEDAEVAALMNEHFVSIKVDREERPDVDHDLHGRRARLLTGSGGWPLTIFLTPDGRPFFAGTYFPPRDRLRQAGHARAGAALGELWRERRERRDRRRRSDRDGDLRSVASVRAGRRALDADLARARRRVELPRASTPRTAASASAPKFPHAAPASLVPAARVAARRGDAAAARHGRADARRPCAGGGIYDQLGVRLPPLLDRRGVARAALREDALRPGPARPGLHARRGRPRASRLLRADRAGDRSTYVLRDLRAPEGGFSRAEDADSEGEEGKFYLWTREEIRPCSATEEAALATRPTA